MINFHMHYSSYIEKTSSLVLNQTQVKLTVRESLTQVTVVNRALRLGDTI